MKKIFLLFAVFASLLFTSCNRIAVWGGDGELLVDEVTLETSSSRKKIGKYRIHCIVLNGYRRTIGRNCEDYIVFNSDSLYNVADTIYIGR